MPQTAMTRTPFGGMNQDDSIITPAKDAAGKNMFEVGDYRYALNARIGSSRNDNFGDLENIRDTVEVTDYYAYNIQQLFQNSEFDGDLDGWLQLDQSPSYLEWGYHDGSARLTLTPDISAGAAPVYYTRSIKQSLSGPGGLAQSVHLAYPAGLQAGDLLYVFSALLHNGATTGSITLMQGGWVQSSNGYFNNTPAFAGNVNGYYKTATGSESGTIELQGFSNVAYNIYAQMYVFRSSAGPVQVETVSINTSGFGDPTILWNGITVGGLHRTLLAFAAGTLGITPPPTGYTEKADDNQLRLFAKDDVSSDGSVTTSGGDPAGWLTAHYAILASAPTATAFTSEVIYQTAIIPIAQQTVNIQFNLVLGIPITSGIINLVYLGGNTIISEEALDSGSLDSITFNQDRLLPINCDGIGIRVGGTFDVVGYVDVQFFRVSTLSTSAPSTRPLGNEIVIGRYEDYEFQRLYYCVWNDLNNHCVRYWDAVTNSVVEVLQWSGLNWLSTSFVKMAKLDNWMALTDRRNAPRLIDVDTISQLRSELANDFREFHISFHKWAPTNPPVTRAYYDGAINNYEKLKNKVFHFSYRYIYHGNLKSRWSPYSKGTTVLRMSSTFYPNQTITAIEVDIPGCIYNDPNDTVTAYNYFDHNDVKFRSAVKSIELAFRDGELELWKLWKRVDVDVLFNRLQYFNGDGLLTPLAQDDFSQLFDTVPFLAGTVEAIDNRFVFADCLDEKPPVENLQIDEIASKQGSDNVGDWSNPRTNGFPGIVAGARERLQRFNALSFLTFKDRAVYKVGIQFLYPTGWRTGTYTTERWIYNVPDVGGLAGSTEHIALNFRIPDAILPPEGAVGYQIMRTNSLNIYDYMYGIVNQFIPIVDDAYDILDEMNLPQHIKDRIAKHFENVRNVSSEEVIAETQKVLTEQIVIDQKKDRKTRRRNNALRANRLFEQSSTGTQTHSLTLEKWLKRTPIGPALQQELRKTKTTDLLANASRILIDVNNWYFGAKETATKEYPLNKLFYNYKEGDRIRFVGSKVLNPTLAQLEEFDVPIIEFTGRSFIIEKPADLLWISKKDLQTLRDYIIEIYSPKTSSEADHIFYETGEWYPVLYPGTPSRDFSKRDFVWTNAAAVTLSQYGPFDIYHKMPLYFGDSYYISKTLYRDKTLGPGSAEAPIFISMNPDSNKTFEYWDKNNGRASIAYEDLPVVRFKTTQARFGGKIVEESFVNNLNNMRDEDQFIYPSEYGRIRDLVNTSNAQVESVGAILLAIGEREAWSIYVNRTTLEDLSGRSQVSISDDVLGSFNTLLGSHGTLNPESVSRNRGRVWWWNAIKGSWVRYGRDGLTEISEYKMRNWFSELGDLLITKYQSAELPKVISEFDPFNRELVTFQDHSTLPATFRGYNHYKGAMFSEDDTRWKGCHNLQPEMMGKINNQMICFKNGSVYQYEKGTAYSSFFGVKYDVMWEPVFNDDAHLKKIWMALAVVATNRWSVERILSEYRGLRNKQQSRILLGSFEEREDNYYAHLNRDITTPNVINNIIEGDTMRSKAIQVLMQLDPAVDYLSLLHYVMTELRDAPKNP
jgi:hypothetical protein